MNFKIKEANGTKSSINRPVEHAQRPNMYQLFVNCQNELQSSSFPPSPHYRRNWSRTKQKRESKLKRIKVKKRGRAAYQKSETGETKLKMVTEWREETWIYGFRF